MVALALARFTLFELLFRARIQSHSLERGSLAASPTPRLSFLRERAPRRSRHEALLEASETRTRARSQRERGLNSSLRSIENFFQLDKMASAPSPAALAAAVLARPRDPLAALLPPCRGPSAQFSPRELKRAFRSAARALHPDKNSAPEAAAAFALLTAALDARAPGGEAAAEAEAPAARRTGTRRTSPNRWTMRTRTNLSHPRTIPTTTRRPWTWSRPGCRCGRSPSP